MVAQREWKSCVVQRIRVKAEMCGSAHTHRSPPSPHRGRFIGSERAALAQQRPTNESQHYFSCLDLTV